MTIVIPSDSSPGLEVDLNNGILFVLGANGSGKSSLMHYQCKRWGFRARWISAHRQNWFSTDTVNMSTQGKIETAKHVEATNNNDQARYKDLMASKKIDLAIFEMIEAENFAGRELRRVSRDGDTVKAGELLAQDLPVDTLNGLMSIANLPIRFSIQRDGQLVASNRGGDPYSLAFMSDGERNALLIAAQVLTAEPGTLILLDEPERHLHRSIISPFLIHLIRNRGDCFFVVATHDLHLPVDIPQSQIMLLRSCNAIFSHPSWVADLVPSVSEIEGDLIADIIGNRRQILFVEGVAGRSLDQSLYSILFPGVSVVSKTNCREVHQAVTAIRGARDFHWLQVFGIVDRDGRSDAEVAELKLVGVYAVPAYSVEAIFYHPDIQRRLAEHHTVSFGGNPADRLESAKQAAIEAFLHNEDGFIGKVIEKKVRSEIYSKMPKRRELMQRHSFDISILISDEIASERGRFQSMIRDRDIEGLIGRYPLKVGNVLEKVAIELGFQDRRQYEGAVLHRLQSDPDLLRFARGLFPDLNSDLEA